MPPQLLLNKSYNADQTVLPSEPTGLSALPIESSEPWFNGCLLPLFTCRGSLLKNALASIAKPIYSSLHSHSYPYIITLSIILDKIIKTFPIRQGKVAKKLRSSRRKTFEFYLKRYGLPTVSRGVQIFNKVLHAQRYRSGIDIGVKINMVIGHDFFI